MSKLFLVLLGMFLCSVSFAQTTTYKSSDEVFELSVPTDWKQNAPPQFTILSYTPPATGKIDSRFKLVMGGLGAGYEEAGIREIADAELAILQKQYGQKATISENRYVLINGKEWWYLNVGIKITKQKEFHLSQYKTIHNKKTYTLSLEGEEEDIRQNSSRVKGFAESFKFLKKDETAYRRWKVDPEKEITATKELAEPAAITNKPVSTPVIEARDTTMTEVVETEKVNEEALGNFAPPSKLSCGSMEGEEGINEKANIASCGNGKVQRNAKTGLRITATNGKQVVFANGPVGYFSSGEMAELTTYVVLQTAEEAASFKYINKSTGAVADLPALYYELSPDKKFAAFFENDISTQFMESFVSVFAVSPNGLKQVFTKKTFDIETGKGWGAAGVKWINNNALEIGKEVVADPTTEEKRSIGSTYIIQQAGKWTMNDKPSGVSLMPSATELPRADQVPAGYTGPVQMPSGDELPTKENAPPGYKGPYKVEGIGKTPAVKLPLVDPKRTPAGATSADDLGKKIINAFKNNDKKAYYNLIANGSFEDASKGFDAVRERLISRGIGDWAKVKFSRTTQKGRKDKNTDGSGNFYLYRVEFSYSSGLFGLLQGGENSHPMVISKGKYFLGWPFTEGHVNTGDWR